MKVNLNKIKEIANEVLHEQYETLEVEDIKNQMRTIVKNAKEKLLMDVLGIEKEWGDGLRLRYSGSFRKNADILSDEKLKPIAKQIWEEIIADTSVDLSEKEKAHLRKVYKESYMNVLEQRIGELAEDQASLDSPKFFEEYLKSLD